jgi:hypothetical protein
VTESQAGARVTTSVRGWGTLKGERAPDGDLFVLFDGADYAIPVPARYLTAGRPADHLAQEFEPRDSMPLAPGLEAGQ